MSTLTPMVLHDPDAGAQLYSVDWTDWVGAAAIAGTPVWSIFPSGPTLSSQAIAGSVASVKVSGGTLGQIYSLTCRATSTAAVVDDRSITLRCGAK